MIYGDFTVSRLLRILLLSATLVSPAALAQDAGDAEVDAGVDAGLGLPDGSAGEGGSDRDNPEGEDRGGRVVVTCNFSSDCTRGFVCDDGRCTWSRYRRAEGGFCGLVSMALLLGAVVVFTRRKPL